MSADIDINKPSSIAGISTVVAGNKLAYANRESQRESLRGNFRLQGESPEERWNKILMMSMYSFQNQNAQNDEHYHQEPELQETG